MYGVSRSTTAKARRRQSMHIERRSSIGSGLFLAQVNYYIVLDRLKDLYKCVIKYLFSHTCYKRDTKINQLKLSEKGPKRSTTTTANRLPMITRPKGARSAIFMSSINAITSLICKRLMWTTGWGLNDACNLIK